MTTGLIMQTLIYVISVEFLSLKGRRLLWRNVQSGEEQGEAPVFLSANANSVTSSTKKIDSFRVITGA